MRVKCSFVLQEIMDDCIIVPIGSEADRLGGVLRVNSTGAFIWNLLSKSNVEKKKLIEEVSREYGIAKDIADKDVEVFLNKLEALGCLEQ